MRVSYVTGSSEKIASFRYRIQEPSKELLRMGIRTTIDRLADKEAEIVLFSKHWTFNDYSYAQFCKLRGQRVVFDICDDHFSHEKLRPHYLRMAELAHIITVNSETMKEVVQKEVSRDAVVIPDPVLTAHVPYEYGRPERGLWFGQKMNFPGLCEVYPEDSKRPLLVISPNITNPPQHLLQEEVQAVGWSPTALDEFGGRASYAVLPYRQGKNAKSANRVLEALNIGLPVLTDRIPSVAALGEHGIFDLKTLGGFEAGVEAIFNAATTGDLEADMEKAQTMVHEKYSPQVVTRLWADLFRSLA